ITVKGQATVKVSPQIINEQYDLKIPSTPPQLSIVIQNASFDVGWDEFTDEMNEKYDGKIVNIVRLKNRNLQELKLVKVEFNVIKTRYEVLEKKNVFIGHIVYKVAEYLALAHVLVCSRCLGIGHFQKIVHKKTRLRAKHVEKNMEIQKNTNTLEKSALTKPLLTNRSNNNSNNVNALSTANFSYSVPPQ
ncbi:unnamed protein product, partial [Didymodactylos carnosus]